MANDFYGNYDMNKMGVMLGDLAFYAKSQSELMDQKKEPEGTKMVDSIAIPTIDDIISCHFFPYLEKEDLNIWETEFDKDRIYIPTQADEGALNDKVLNRVRNVKVSGQLKTITTFDKYRVEGTNIGGDFKWQNEGKLWLPPYSYIMLDDNYGEPMKIFPNLIEDKEDTFAVKVRHSLNHLGVYTLFVPNYMGDESGLFKGTTISGLRMPNSSNTYADYMNQNRNQIKHQKGMAVANLAMSVGGAVMGGIMGNPFAIAGGIASGVSNVGSIIGQIATEKDMMAQGNRLTSEGGDIVHGLQISMGLTAYYMKYPKEVLERIGWFFHMYGYKQNTVMKPKLRSRHFYNYIKTTGVNIQADGVPKEHLLKLKSIYDNGTTIWHIDRSGVVIGDYSKDNYEV